MRVSKPVKQEVKTSDGVRIAMDLYANDQASATIIICPGFFQSKGTPTFCQLSQALAQQYNVVAMDFRGHGQSGGV